VVVLAKNETQYLGQQSSGLDLLLWNYRGIQFDWNKTSFFFLVWIHFWVLPQFGWLFEISVFKVLNVHKCSL